MYFKRVNCMVCELCLINKTLVCMMGAYCSRGSRKGLPSFFNKHSQGKSCSHWVISKSGLRKSIMWVSSSNKPPERQNYCNSLKSGALKELNTVLSPLVGGEVSGFNFHCSLLIFKANADLSIRWEQGKLKSHKAYYSYQCCHFSCISVFQISIGLWLIFEF